MAGSSSGARRFARALLTLIVLLGGLLWSASASSAQEIRAIPPGEGETQEPARRHELALVLPSTWEHDEDRNFPTVGIEYEVRLARFIGAGAELEYVTDFGAWVYVFPITIRPVRGLKVFGGPGLERKVDEEGLDTEIAAAPGASRNHLLWRVGAGYAVELTRRYSVTPNVSFDFVRESGRSARAVVYGITLGVAF